jgi:hypothetical protein
VDAKTRIREALKQIMSEGEANACEVFKGYEASTNWSGWHYIRFGGTATFIGANLAEALKWIENLADERKQF